MNNVIEDTKNLPISYTKIFLLMGVIIASIISGILFMGLSENSHQINELYTEYINLEAKYNTSIQTASKIREYYDELKNYYDELENVNIGLQEIYYDLRNRYAELQNEHLGLENSYSKLLSDKKTLEQELEEFVNFGRQETLEENRSVIIPIEDNVVLTYNISYAGYFNVTFASNTGVVIWVGSSETEYTYYARYPTTHLEVSTNASFTVPVCGTVYIYIGNHNEFEEANVFLAIDYFY
jgi:hypothetical protein